MGGEVVLVVDIVAVAKKVGREMLRRRRRVGMGARGRRRRERRWVLGAIWGGEGGWRW